MHLRSSMPFAIAFALSLAAAAAPAQTVLIAHSVTSQWSTGFQGRITILNQAPYTIHDWRLGTNRLASRRPMRSFGARSG